MLIFSYRKMVSLVMIEQNKVNALSQLGRYVLNLFELELD